MKEELINGIKKDYEDFSKIIESDFAELNDEFITPGRYKRVQNIQEKYSHWLTSEDIDINDHILDEAISMNINNNEIGDTNKVLMYISELEYDTYQKLFAGQYELPEMSSTTTYILYMDIEDNSKYFIAKEYQEEFEKTHNVIVTYKNPNCNAGWNFDRNIEGLKEIRREFIKDSLYTNQEESVAQLTKKYPNN